MRSYAHKSRKKAARRMSELDYALHLEKLGKAATAAAPKAARSKFGNEKVVHDGQTFDSKREFRHWLVLLDRQARGVIHDLQRQVPFVLAPAVDLGEKRKKTALRYIADFVYVDAATGEKIVEDSKGKRTDMYRAKKHLMAVVHSIIVREV
jgi:hypothetical protein